MGNLRYDGLGKGGLFFWESLIIPTYFFHFFIDLSPRGITFSLCICNSPRSNASQILPFCSHTQNPSLSPVLWTSSCSLCFILSHLKLTFYFQGYFICILSRFSAIFHPLLSLLLNSHPFCWNSSSPLLAGKWKVTVSLSPSNVMILCSFVCYPGCFYVFPVGKPPLFCYTEAASAQFQRQSAKPHFSALSLTQLPLWGDNMFQSSSHPFLLVVFNFPTKMQSFQWFCLLRNKILLPK